MANCDKFLDVGVETTPTPRLYYYSCVGGIVLNPAIFKKL